MKLTEAAAAALNLSIPQSWDKAYYFGGGYNSPPCAFPRGGRENGKRKEKKKNKSFKKTACRNFCGSYRRYGLYYVLYGLQPYKNYQSKSFLKKT